MTTCAHCGSPPNFGPDMVLPQMSAWKPIAMAPKGEILLHVPAQRRKSRDGRADASWVQGRLAVPTCSPLDAATAAAAGLMK